MVKNINIDFIFVHSYNPYIPYFIYSAKLYYIQITKLTSFIAIFVFIIGW